MLNNITYDFVKVYPTYAKYYHYKTPKINISPPKQNKKASDLSETPSQDIELNDNNNISNIRRTRTTISDIAQCNNFTQFATFTFDKKKIDRTDIKLTKKHMSLWLKSIKRKHPQFKYLIVPEFHKNKKAIHFHALLENYPEHYLIPECKHTKKGKYYCSETHIHTPHKQRQRPLYNTTTYKLGFTTIVKIDNVKAVSSYIRKYITKDMPQIQNQKKFWHSYNCIRPKLYKNQDLLSNPFIKLQHKYENDYYEIYETSDTLTLHTNHTSEEIYNSWQQKQITQTTLNLSLSTNEALLTPKLKRKLNTLRSHWSSSYQTAKPIFGNDQSNQTQDILYH